MVEADKSAAQAVVDAGEIQRSLRLDRIIEPMPVMKLDDDIVKAMQKIGLIDETLKRLPGLDCGSCGSPTCRALAEDIVLRTAQEGDCVFRLRDMVRILAQEMVELAAQLPPSLNREKLDQNSVDPKKKNGDDA